MGVRMTFTGGEEFSEKLRALGTDAEGIARMALYDGAGVVAKALKNAVGQLPRDNTSGRPFNGPLDVITTADLADLAAGVGIAKFGEDSRNRITTSITFNGYARRTEGRYPKGVPLAMIARSIESGSSVRKKHPFVRKTARAAKSAALAAIAETAEAEINKHMEGD